MAICSECGGGSFRYIADTHGHFMKSVGEGVMEKGALWQCNGCKRLVHYNNWGNGTLPASDIKV